MKQTSNLKKELGSWGEEKAAEHLRQRGYRLLEKNFRIRRGELDLVARQDNSLVFVEVKTREPDADFSPLDNFTAEKQRRILKIAKSYLMNQPPGLSVRFDLITVVETNHKVQIDHFEDVIQDTDL